MIQCTVKGDFKMTRNFLKKMQKLDFESLLEKYAEEGVEALASATPKRTGKTAASWTYEIEKRPGRISVFWVNTNISNGVSIALIVDTGHGNGKGVYIEGRHYISPAIQPIFDKIVDAVNKEVANS